LTPELSVVIPTRGRPEWLSACLDALRAQRDADGSFEVVVVADGPDVETESMVAGRNDVFPLRLVTQDHTGAAAARNRGVEHADGRFLLFLDDVVVADPGLVAAHLDVQRRTGGVVGIGRIDKSLREGAARWARARQSAWAAHYDRLAAGRTPRFNDCYGGNLSVPAAGFAAVGGFAADISVEHDVELGYRLAAGGLRLVYVADAVVREEDRESLLHFLSDAEERGVSAVTLYRRHPPVLPELRLGGKGEPGRKLLMLRRLLLPLRVPPALLGIGGTVIRNERRTGSWYAFVYGYCYWRGVRRATDPDTWRRLQRGVPILMYHALGASGERASRFVVPQARFKRQMSWLQRRGYHVISLEELVACRRDHRLPPAKSIVVTLDDGYVDNVELALPVLERYGFPATVFLVSRAGEQATWTPVPEIRGRRLLTLTAAKALVGRFDFGAHTRTHPRLTELTPVELEEEVAGSRADLEAELGIPVLLFAYPFGDRNPEVEAATASAGFLAACSVVSGRNRPIQDGYALRRIEIWGTDSLVRFALTLWIGDMRSQRRRRDR
jgi:peptidoglycan/xylan/chitin deacetylase (PgdA/CDA1 family)/glycosyltransferase involved in cell wall biosynthesis